MRLKKERILDTAALLFRRKGYKATTLQEIAQGVQMEAPSLYNHISSKQQILAELLLPVAHKFIESLEAIDSATLAPIVRLEKLFEVHIDLTIKYPHTMSLMLAEYVHLESELLDEFLRLREMYDQGFKQIVSACMKGGEIKKGNLELITFNLLSTLRSLYAWILRHPEMNRYQLEEELKDYLLNGIVP